MLLPQRTSLPAAPDQTVAAAHSMDRSFVADCVAQHRRDAAGEPLADLAAQNLAGHLDNAAPAAALRPPIRGCFKMRFLTASAALPLLLLPAASSSGASSGRAAGKPV